MGADHRVLVAYASKNGSTAQIAEWIGARLRERGLEVEVRAARGTPDCSYYTAVVLGSGLYERRWLRDAVRFVRRHRHELLKVPVWLFSSGPLDGAAGVREIPPVERVARLAERVDSAEHVTFGGRLAEGAGGLVARQLLAQGKGGDFRDRDRIVRWADHIADELLAGADTPPARV
ncbi:flavodoxin domain-containing protein [Streptomyces sp. NBC_00448]|uniref:flavodoxin domain-containing protein n=1 Tax=Streptomyces sp. NBC_00448 TaxID=2903652 RepID=UPI002E1CA805